MALPHALQVAASLGVSAARFAAGRSVGPLGPRPATRLELYEFEGCPFCRRVREALSMLDLDATVYPCPKRGTRYRPIARERGGKEQFPLLIDPNAGLTLYESADIVAHLYRAYGAGPVPARLAATPAVIFGGAAGRLLRGRRGSTARFSRAPAVPLELWSFEPSPYCRLVREVLCGLELPYVLHNVAKGSPRRAGFVARAGKMQVPYLFDPNTDTGLYESADIERYLEATYGSA